MHPAVRVFTIALVIVLLCSHLLLNRFDKAHDVSLKHKSVRLTSMKGFNDERSEMKLMNRIGDMNIVDAELESGDELNKGVRTVKQVAEEPVDKPVEVPVVGDEADEGGNDNDTEQDGDEVEVDEVERKDQGEDCEGGDGDGDGDGEGSA